MGRKTFILDGKFLWTEAKVGFRGFFMPFIGIYAALTGQDVVLVKRDQN